MKVALLPVLALSLVMSSLIGCSAPAGDDAGEGAATDESGLTEAAPLGPAPQGHATVYPIVLVHGFLGGANGFASFHTLVSEGLAADGHAVYRASLPPAGDVHQRARALAHDVDAVLAKTGAAKVNIVAHSMGGLDARDLVSTLGYGDRVASLTTISTPHRGSAVADVGLRFLAGANDQALDALAGLIGKTRGDIATDANLRGAFVDLAEASAPAFQASHPDDARVYYQSWAGVSSLLAIPNPADERACDGMFLHHQGRADLMSPVLAAGAPFVAHGADPNDGLVRVESAKWGHFRGCVPADHAGEIGVFRNRALDPRTGFDFVRFHRNIAFDLAARGF